MHISAIVNGHREGLLAGPAIGSFQAAIAHARNLGIEVEPVAVLDRPDDLTRAIFEETDFGAGGIVFTDHGDPGLARNRGVAASHGDFVTFLDADDLWSFNWLAEAHAFSSAASKPLVAHSEMNILFGEKSYIWLHRDSESPDFDPGYLSVGNYWDAMAFAPRQIYLDHPYKANALDAGYGHEDWHWNCVTLLAGHAHRPVPGTVHMKRKRRNSQESRCADNDVVIWPTDLLRYETQDRLAAQQRGGTRGD